MLPDPLHAAVVHFPIVFAVVLPVVALLTLIAIGRGARPRRWWGATVLLMLALVASSFVAVRTGEAEEDRVEGVVGEQVLHTHEEAGERFLLLTAGLFILGVAGLFPRRAGATFRVLSAVGTLGILAAGWQVGHSGGELVYRHGAAEAYTRTAPDPAPGAIRVREQRRADEREEGRAELRRRAR
jgi:uncharacterized membrane protein